MLWNTSSGENQQSVELNIGMSSKLEIEFQMSIALTIKYLKTYIDVKKNSFIAKRFQSKPKIR